MNKKYFLSVVVCVCAGFLFTGCDKDDNKGSESSVISGIQAKVENGTDYNSEIDVVKALMGYDQEYDPSTGEYYWSGYEVATGSYINGGFTLNLPATLDAKYLRSFDEDDFPAGIKLSDVNAKTTASTMIIVAYKSGTEVGEFVYCNKNYYEDKGNDEISADFIYSDRDVSITGSETEDEDNDETRTVIYNVSLKKGWNELYIKRSYTEKNYTREWTSKKPTGLKWYFEEYDNNYKSPYSPTKAPAKTVGKQKLFSSLKTK